MNIAPEQPEEEEDAKLPAAIAASLQESQRPRCTISAFASQQARHSSSSTGGRLG